MDSSRSPVAFSSFIMGLASAALIDMGLVENPSSKKKEPHIERARQHIELLGLLQEKTRGNLSDDEKVLLERALTDLRLEFAKLSQEAKK
jgi:hypothetical protein